MRKMQTAKLKWSYYTRSDFKSGPMVEQKHKKLSQRAHLYVVNFELSKINDATYVGV